MVKRKTGWQWIGMLLILFFLIHIHTVTAYAAEELPDLARQGTISLTLQDKKNQKSVAGGELTLYPAAELQMQDGTLQYRYTNGFENSGIGEEDLAKSETASRLAEMVSASTQGTAQTISETGTVVFSNLSAGLYLIMQTKASSGYEPISAFLVSLPQQDGDGWNYQVDATPKVETITAVVTPTPVTPPHTGHELPYTGQHNLPVPILAVTGLVLMLLGWYLTGEKKQHAA